MFCIMQSNDYISSDITRDFIHTFLQHPHFQVEKRKTFLKFHSRVLNNLSTVIL